MVSHRIYHAIVGILALSGLFLLLMGPTVGSHIAADVSTAAAGGSTVSVGSANQEVFHIVGGLLLGSGLLGITRAAGAPSGERLSRRVVQTVSGTQM